jgi:transposase
MIAKLAGGLSRNRVAREVGAAVSTVVTTAKRFEEAGITGLYDRRRFNGPRKVDAPFHHALTAVLRSTPQEFGWERPTWTRELLCLEMKRRSFPLVAACTMGRALVAIDARLGRPKPIVCCPWPAAQRDARLAQLERVVRGATRRDLVVYADEVDIHLNPKIGPDWMLRGTQRQVTTPGKNEKRYLAGALNALTRQLTWVEGKKKRSDLFCQLLWRLVAEHRSARRIHVILDNYIIHSSKITRRCVEQLNGKIVLHFLPPYCPDHNRIERVWLDLHANVTRNHRCRTMNELMRRVRRFLRAYNNRHERNPSLRRHPRRAAA